MKTIQTYRIRNRYKLITIACLGILLYFFVQSPVSGQDVSSSEDYPVRFVFESSLLIDNQTVDVPIKGTFQFDIQHRFGTLANGYDDFFGLYASSNIRLGLSFVPRHNLCVGLGLTKVKNLLDLNLKYAILKQTRSGRIPCSITYFGNMGIDTRAEDRREEIYNSTDRYSYFHQLMIGRKFNNWLSVQVAPSLSHFNMIEKTMENDHIAIAFGAQVRVSGGVSVIGNVDQPITKHDYNNPNPNVSVGIQIATSSHAFQIFLGNYRSILPQENNFFNDNNYEDGFKENFLIGFNITRLWNF